MERRRNPFHEIYLTESISTEKYVRLFSPLLIDQALALFEPGHVILKGLPGTGKSMLLGLFKPTVRLAYFENGINFPIPEGYRKFIGAGVHLKRSGAGDFGQRPMSKTTGFEESPFYFADFLNYWIVLDILKSIECLEKLSDEVGIDVDVNKLNQFSIDVAKHHCWNDFMKEVKSYEDFKKVLNERISCYRNFLNYNIEELPESIKSSKTDIGIPILALAKCLREFGIISESTEIFVRIDQFEELAWLESMPEHVGISYQAMVRKLLAMRDTSVSYRIGTRYFAWDDSGEIFGTSAKLEKDRHYIDISIDTLLRRKENRKTWIFPDFAEDILKRRVTLSGDLSKSTKKKTLDIIFGTSAKAEEEAKAYVKTNRSKAVKLDSNWPKPWKDFLIELAENSPFSARLGEAWVKQKDESKRALIHNVPQEQPFPWEKKKWWIKERVEQGLLQIASRNQQQLIWYGKEDIISLCGSNILAFLILCRNIWDVWIRDSSDKTTINNLELIDPLIQSVGIFEASNSWFQNLSLEMGGKKRKLFISFLGAHFYKTLVEDEAMSNPGHNGFSLDIQELEKNSFVQNFLNDATDFGDLYDAPHTSKLGDKRPRKKWYLNPILSPHFKIPSIHTKEPIYLGVEDIEMWIKKSLRDERQGKLDL